MSTINLRRLVVALAGLLLAACATGPAREAVRARPPVLLVSLDGFRPDYLNRGVTPTLSRLAARGVRAQSMRPSFPSLTFPNHYTLVTGLRPDRHGIVDNTFEDPAIPGLAFKLADKAVAADPRWWDGAEPIWVTAEKAGVRTATMFWPGSDGAIRGVRPADWRPYDKKVAESARVDQVLAWLGRPAATRPRFVTLYFDTVDTAGHDHGPDSAELNAAVGAADAELGRLLDGLRARGLERRVDLVIVADHGMAATSYQRIVPLADLVDPALVRVVTQGPSAGLQPAEGKAAAFAAMPLRPHPHARCWRKADIPAALRYGASPRVPPVFCLADVGWLILRPDRAAKAVKEQETGGAHGYDNAEPTMGALFVASGPSFRRGVVLPPFDNVDVQPLLSRLLGIAAPVGDGSVTPLLPGLRDGGR